MKNEKINYFVLTSFVLMINAVSLLLYTLKIDKMNVEAQEESPIEMISDIEEEKGL